MLRWLLLTFLLLIHLLYGIVRIVIYSFHVLYEFIYSASLYVRFQSNETRCIQHYLPKKHPKSIAIVIGNENDERIHFRNLSKILKWLYFSNVERVAIYDREGKVKNDIELLESLFFKEMEATKSHALQISFHKLNVRKHFCQIIPNSNLNFNLNKTDLNKTNLNKTDFNKTNLNKTDLNKTDFNKTDLNKTDFNKIDVDKSSNLTSIGNFEVDSNQKITKLDSKMKVDVLSKEEGKTAMAAAISFFIQTSLQRRREETESMEKDRRIEKKERKDDRNQICDEIKRMNQTNKHNKNNHNIENNHNIKNNKNNKNNQLHEVSKKNQVKDNLCNFIYPKMTKDDLEKSLNVVGALCWHPDAIFVFGNFISLEEFSPWHNGACEIIFMKQLKHLNFSKFLFALRKFSKSTQRFGK